MSEQVQKEAADAGQKVVVTDICVPFDSLVVLLIKLALAAIPAGALLALLYYVVMVVLASV